MGSECVSSVLESLFISQVDKDDRTPNISLAHPIRTGTGFLAHLMKSQLNASRYPAENPSRFQRTSHAPRSDSVKR